MRILTRREMIKRGCIDCADHYKNRYEECSLKKINMCRHKECPYHELDPFNTYAEYLKSPGQNRLKEALEKM